MEEEEETAFSPFWLPGTPWRRLRRSTSSVIFSSGAFVVLLVAVALAFVFVIIPYMHSFTSQILRPNTVKRSWDSLNLVLVLFAVVCAFLGRNNAPNDDENSIVSDNAAAAQPRNNDVIKPIQPAPPRYEYSDQTGYNHRGVNRVSSIMRSSSSYPDLRQEYWIAGDDDEQWRFHDDTHFVSSYREVPTGSSRQVRQQHRRRSSWHDEYYDDVTRTKNIPVDTFVIRTEQAIPESDVSVAPPRKPKRTYHRAVGEKEARNDDAEDIKSSKFRQPPPEPVALPVVEEAEVAKSQRREKNVKKKTGSVANTKELISSLRKKKHTQKSVDNVETLLNSATSSSTPPPPPPPPPPSVFPTLFQSRKTKPKKTHHSHSHSPPPPEIISAADRRLKAQMRPMITTTAHEKPPLPVMKSFMNNMEDETSNSGESSPLASRIPPPPPLPPFKIPAMKFVVHGDFVRIKSSDSSRSGSPVLEEYGDEEEEESGTSSPARGVLFCPSSDVDTKADTFIATFRAGLRLEKVNSVNERGRTTLGPGYTERLGPI